MTFFRLLWLNLWFHRRAHLALLLAVTLGTAVLTGALLVGDSLRGSLRALTLDRLGWVEQALTSNRFFRAALAQDLGVEKAASLLILHGSATVPQEEDKNPPRAGQVVVIGADARFWGAATELGSDFWDSDRPEVVLNAELAAALKVKVGDRLYLSVQKTQDIPRESLLGRRALDEQTRMLRVDVKAILPPGGLADFSLEPTPQAVRNAFLPLGFLQKELEQPGRANVLLAGGTSEDLAARLKKSLQLADWGLRLRTPQERAGAFYRFLARGDAPEKLASVRWRGRLPEALARKADADGNLTLADFRDYYGTARNYLVLESRQLLLDQVVADAATAPKGPLQDWPRLPVLIYLADTLAGPEAEVPYAIIAAVPHLPPAAPGKVPVSLSGKDMVLLSWPGSPFQAEVGAPMRLDYYVADDQGSLTKKQAAFTLKGKLPVAEVPWADDPDWTPEFPGITDQVAMRDWVNPPFPYAAQRVKKPDEDYWKRFKTTPRAYIALEVGQKLWGSRFGNLTSVRLSPTASGKLEPERAARQLLVHLDPRAGGFVFRDVRGTGMRAGGGSSDFGMLFLAFSFFLIVSALLLVGLMTRLSLDRRASELGLLQALGWTAPRVRRLLLAEASLGCVLAGLLGLLAAVGYAALMLRWLQRTWPGGGELTFLRLHAEPTSLAIGFVAGLLVNVATIWWSLRVLSRLAPRALMAGETTPPRTPSETTGRSLWVLLLSLAGAVAAFVAGLVVQGHEAKAGSFFGCGALVLTAALTLAWRRLNGGGDTVSDPQPTLTRLGIRNAGRHPLRSLLTAGLLASATFLIVAVESFHREIGAEFLQKDGGSGGFALILQTQVPLTRDLNEEKARLELFAQPYQEKLLARARFVSCRLRQGDDASCLNLYQPLQPRLLGVPPSLIEAGGFRFGPTLAETPEEKANPWKLLERRPDDGAIPVFADANTATWILKVGLGDSLEIPDAAGTPRKFRIVGLLQESIFQSELVLSRGRLLELYPHLEGSTFVLVDCPPEDAPALARALESLLADAGAHVQTTTSRVESYLAVENMYLGTFQALGGLGLLLGACGLAVVLLRGVWERRGELALLQALGFRRRALGWLVLAENLYLLALGLGAGIFAAALAVAPQLLGGEAGRLTFRVALLLGGVVLVGLAAGAGAVAATLRTPILGALRKE